ncbi:SMP-30/gluconolactonase/LRE family protein [Algibacter amylolyticus]|uniref:SMP-30/gluconolactonase/LRE family protein n=1 Tax=Algibacter amylolyticus TaxID=1608400 RepID=A0A5M7BG70_9FLAO|nr:SMP-30/gluconolactonase/LRE family protein [Algibacter amylolyticus]KAA5826421.1 SMP-30/gluconolactonase/LRE family protein [Algibacter amylolyticus]MBB5268630.1 gluconolactonase [Algibacter amylolyticus]TSJ80459.1 SMP-30/gluconolactonase/LRE family protein [Algibacter amylolyticus]
MMAKLKIHIIKYRISVIGVLWLAILNLSCKSSDGKKQNLVAEGAKLMLVSNAFEFTEGPAADKSGNVYFTDQPNNSILKWNALDNSVSEYMKPAGRANGLYFDNDGNLLAAADEKNELWRIDSNKKVTVLAGDFNTIKFNGPNDIWVDAKGGVYFTDPYYKRTWWAHKSPPQEEKRVYYLAPNASKVKVVVHEGYLQPNGIIGTPNGKTLYVADQAGNKTYAYTITNSGDLIDKKLFANLGSDGMTIDHLGNVYLTGNGVTVFSPEGKQIEKIEVPQNWTANVTFGGKEQNILFITALNSIYTLKMNVRGTRY